MRVVFKQCACTKQEPQRRKHLPCSVTRFAFSVYSLQLQTTDGQVIFRVLILLHRSSSHRCRMTVEFSSHRYRMSVEFSSHRYRMTVEFSSHMYHMTVEFSSQVSCDCSIFHNYYKKRKFNKFSYSKFHKYFVS
jgi:hypothetical protein